MKKISLLGLSLILLTACNNTSTAKIKNSVQTETIQEVSTVLPTKKTSLIAIPEESTQLLVVETANWSTKEGVLQRYEKKNKHWEKVGESISIVLGRNGLGWGLGLHKTPKNAPYVKKEGDGKAPAGLFSLNTAFGYSPANFSMHFPYATYKTTDHCVDDSNSIWYNKIVDSTTTQKDYKSFEHMKLKNNLYKYGIVVNHNPQQKSQAGSCIFMHIKSQSGRGTAGCTAMNENKIVEVLKWLKGEEKPLLLQLPKEEMVKVILN